MRTGSSEDRLKVDIAAMRMELLTCFILLGDMGSNLREAADWAKGKTENERDNAVCMLEGVSAAAVELNQNLRTIALKCEEIALAETKI